VFTASSRCQERAQTAALQGGATIDAATKWCKLSTSNYLLFTSDAPPPLSLPDLTAPLPARSQGSVFRKEEQLPICIPSMLPGRKLCSTYQFIPMSSGGQEDPVLCEVRLRSQAVLECCVHD